MAASSRAFQFDIATCVAELGELRDSLRRNQLILEREQILPFFKQRRHLSAFLATFNVHAAAYDWLAPEYSFGGAFRADLIAGDQTRSAYCLVEFENAAATSVFTSPQSGTPKWSRRFEVGFGQLVDWFWKVDELRGTASFRSEFGEQPVFTGLLVLGRQQTLAQQEQDRLKWRERNVQIGGRTVQCITYDELFTILERRCSAFGHQV